MRENLKKILNHPICFDFDHDKCDNCILKFECFVSFQAIGLTKYRRMMFALTHIRLKSLGTRGLFQIYVHFICFLLLKEMGGITNATLNECQWWSKKLIFFFLNHEMQRIAHSTLGLLILQGLCGFMWTNCTIQYKSVF